MAARGVGSGVDAREELLEALPLTPLVVGTDDGEETVDEAGRLAPQLITVLGGDLAFPKVGKSPSERRLGGLLYCLGLGDGVVLAVSLSASSCRSWAGEREYWIPLQLTALSITNDLKSIFHKKKYPSIAKYG